jgi:hypothetical protein
MIRKLIAAEVGRRLAGRDNGIKGALIGAAAPWLMRRAFTPAGVAHHRRDRRQEALRREEESRRICDKSFAGITRSAPAKELQ